MSRWKGTCRILIILLITGCAATKPAEDIALIKEFPEKETVLPKPPIDKQSAIFLDSAGRPAGTGDLGKPAGVAFRIGQGWHPAALSAAGLPKDKYGLVDWTKIVRENLIAPAHSLNPADIEMPPLIFDVLVPAKSDFVNNVVFPHETHTYWFQCEMCHPKIFVPSKGETKMSMVEISQGKFCGVCHGKVAFPISDCIRCHTQPKASITQK